MFWVPPVARTARLAVIVAAFVAAGIAAPWLLRVLSPARPEVAANVREKASSEALSFTYKYQPVINEDRPEFILAVPVVNQTGRDVDFRQITAACGCSKPMLDAYRLAPAERTALKISLNLHGRSGVQRISAFLEEKSGPSWHYLIEVPVFPRARFSHTADRVSVPRCQPNADGKGGYNCSLRSCYRFMLFVDGPYCLKITQ